MDVWRWYDISHRDLAIWDPLSSERLDEAIGLLDLPPRPRVVELGPGRGELAIRLVKRFAASVVAIDRSPYAVADLRRAVAARVPDADVEILEMDGAAYHAEPASFDLAVCLGATWIHGGLDGTLGALRDATRPGGRVLVGHPHWRHEPAPAYLEHSGQRLDEWGSIESNVEATVSAGLRPWFLLVSSEAEWDHYETLQWGTVERFLAAHPDDPDRDEIRRRLDAARVEYVRWGRDTLGWAVYGLGKPGG